MKILAAAFLILAIAGPSCAHPPRPYRFTIAQPRNDVDVVIRTLVADGLEPDAVNRDKGTVTTRWRDTGYRFREIDDGRNLEYDTNVFLRFKVSLLKHSGSETVTLDPQVQRCSPLDAVVVANGILGTCQPMTTLPLTHQEQTDRLGAELRMALEGGRVTGG